MIRAAPSRPRPYQSFFYGRAFSSLDDLRSQTAAWRDQVANERIHATPRERPAERLLLERTRLKRIRDAEVSRIDRRGHIPQAERPEETWAHVAGFLGL